MRNYGVNLVSFGLNEGSDHFCSRNCYFLAQWWSHETQLEAIKFSCLKFGLGGIGAAAGFVAMASSREAPHTFASPILGIENSRVDCNGSSNFVT